MNKMNELQQIIYAVTTESGCNVVIFDSDQDILDKIKMSLSVETRLIPPRFSTNNNIIYVIPCQQNLKINIGE